MAEARGIVLQTPLGADALFPTGFRGREGLSQLFHFQLDMLAENRKEIAFDKLIGQKVSFSLALPDGKSKRHWSGICVSMAQNGRDSTFTRYRMEVAPQFWLLTRRTQCRIFQYQTIPDILKAVLTGLDVKFEIQGTFEPRDYCVQYRETDFAFASRLMEEEGIYYYFKFDDGSHQMVVANTPQSHAATPFAAKAIYEELEGGNRPEMRVTRWEKSQELRSGKVTLWDHHFELPHQHLDAERPTMESVSIGKATHKLKLPANDPLELYDYPGAYAQRFDGVDRGGGDQPAELTKIFQDNKRTASIRMEQEAAQAILIRGGGNCRQFTAGHKFALDRHFNADGDYVLTTVEHSATASGARSGEGEDIVYSNHFTCIPLALPFRPPQTVDRPYIAGPQTAVVTGPPGEIIFCDKYGRIKVQFHWDRAGKNDADSSCWVRASQNWGGASWGGMFIPHVGQEVIVEFEEGDPDRPLVTGRVYNAQNMPPLKLPDNKTQSIIQDHGGNKMKLQGHGGDQQIEIFSPTGKTQFILGAPGPGGGPGNGFYGTTDLHWEMNITLNNIVHIGGNVLETIDKDKTTKILGSVAKHVFGDFNEKINGSHKLTLGGMKTELIIGKEFKTIMGSETKINLINKNDIIHARNVKITKGKLYDINNATVILKGPSWKEARQKKQESLEKKEEKVDKAEQFTKALREEIERMEQKIDKATQDIKELSSNFDKYKLDVKGNFDAKAKQLKLIISSLMDIKADLHVNGNALTVDK